MGNMPIKLSVFLKQHDIRSTGTAKMIIKRLERAGAMVQQGKLSNKKARAVLQYFASKLDIPESLIQEHKSKYRSRKVAKSTGSKFYSSWEWKKVRYEAIKRYGAKCMCCGATERIVVDHIKPVSKYPQLALDLNNLQILCNCCNRGKSNDDMTDWREQKPVPDHDAEILNRLQWHGII